MTKRTSFRILLLLLLLLASAATLAPGELIAGSGDEGRDLTSGRCRPLSCHPELHFATERQAQCDPEGFFFAQAQGDTDATVCTQEGRETVLLLTGLEDCVEKIHSVSFRLTRPNGKVRKWTEYDWPYTVFGDENEGETFGAAALREGPYQLNVKVHGRRGCTLLTKQFRFTVDYCGDDVLESCCAEHERECADGTCVYEECCWGETECGDGSCAPSGQCCEPERLCADGMTCVDSETCCPEEKPCQDGTCVPESSTCQNEPQPTVPPTPPPTKRPTSPPTSSPTMLPTSPPTHATRTILIDGKNIVLSVITENNSKTTVTVGEGNAELVLTQNSATFTILGLGLSVIPSFEVPFSSPIPVPVSPDGALLLAEFLVRQIYAALNDPNPTTRRLDSPGCDSFPDSTCTLGCCAVHDRCFAENGCTSKSWIRNLCLPLLLGGLVTGNPIATGLGTLFCTAGLIFITGECAKCNQVAVNCIVSGCLARNDSNKPEVCYDNKCNVEFECPGVCDTLALDDTKCCGCLIPGASCGSPASCGNGVCDFGESISNCFVDCAYNQCAAPEQIQCGAGSSSCVNPTNDEQNCGACFNSCPSATGAGFNACVNGKCSTPIAVSWGNVGAVGVQAGGGWVISNGGRTIRFVVEDSGNCGGPNNQVQSGVAEAIISISADYDFVPEIVGVAELQDAGFENMVIRVDGSPVIMATSTNLDLNCTMGPIVATNLVTLPLRLGAGQHTFDLSFTTSDPLFHVGAFYELNLVFQPVLP